MDVLDQFTQYLAQAYECAVVVLEGLNAPGSSLVCAPPCLVVWHIEAFDQLRVIDGLTSLHCAMGEAAMGVWICCAAGVPFEQLHREMREALADARWPAAFVGAPPRLPGT